MPTRVRMLQYISGNDRRYDIGEVCSLPDELAARWIKDGFAEAADELAADPAPDGEPPASETETTRAEGDEPEAATLDNAPETATLPKARKRG